MPLMSPVLPAMRITFDDAVRLRAAQQRRHYMPYMIIARPR